MVSSSRSLRTRGADHTLRSRRPIVDTEASLPTRNSLRSKRVRGASIPTHEQSPKRRKVAPNNDIDGLRIPLRSKEVTANSVLTRPLLTLNSLSSASSNSPLNSPSSRPQYDQIRRIEEKARQAIREGPNAEHPDDRRKLRSEHGGSRAKTELSQYFPNFDEMLSLEPPDPDQLTAKTRLILVDDLPGFQPAPGPADPFGAFKPLHNVEYLDLGPYAPSSTRAVIHEPLSIDTYYKAHRKAERHEKQMKNGDKERAQHEKYQLEKILDDLRGPDWLKTLGVTGITDSEKKRYEPKRALFIRETRALIDKFKRWKEEEKRRKLEKEQAQLEDATEAEDNVEVAASTSTRKYKRRSLSHRTSPFPDVSPADKGHDLSEIDALASQQLLQEAKTAAALRRKKAGEPELPPPPEVHKPFLSFFSKRHIRDAAVAGRQRGRTVMAFGKPVPELEEANFHLSDDILTDDAIRASQRNRRRARREIDE